MIASSSIPTISIETNNGNVLIFYAWKIIHEKNILLGMNPSWSLDRKVDFMFNILVQPSNQQAINFVEKIDKLSCGVYKNIKCINEYIISIKFLLLLILRQQLNGNTTELSYMCKKCKSLVEREVILEAELIPETVNSVNNLTPTDVIEGFVNINNDDFLSEYSFTTLKLLPDVKEWFSNVLNKPQDDIVLIISPMLLNDGISLNWELLLDSILLKENNSFTYLSIQLKQNLLETIDNLEIEALSFIEQELTKCINNKNIQISAHKIMPQFTTQYNTACGCVICADVQHFNFSPTDIINTLFFSFSLKDYYDLVFKLKKGFGFMIEEINNLLPFEKDIYIQMANEYNKKLEENEGIL